MRISRVLHSWVRRWYVAVGFGVLTLGAVTLSLQVEGVYSARVNVVFLAPTAQGGNTLRDTSISLINFAALVEREYNGNDFSAKFSKPSATLYGAGVSDGYSVALVDNGGQWAQSFTSPVLSVEVVGASENSVRAELARVVDGINAVAAAEQDRASVSVEDRITTLTSPQTAVVVYADGSRTRATAGIVLLGLVTGAVGTTVIDRLLSGRGRSRRQPQVLAP